MERAHPGIFKVKRSNFSYHKDVQKKKSEMKCITEFCVNNEYFYLNLKDNFNMRL